MPSRDRHPAKFGPIPPDLDLRTLVEQTANFQWVDRISCKAIDEQGTDAFEKTVNYHVIGKGIPLVVDGWQEKLERWTFSPQWLRDNNGNKFEQARNLTKQENLPLSIAHYLNNMALLTDQWTHFNYKDTNRQRLYLKDIDCPDLWHEKLRETIPSSVFYLNENTGEIGGPGAVDERNPNGIGIRKSKGVARAGDLMSCLPATMRAENLMCYIGHEGTYTPAHREMCATLGQNIMVETSEALDEGGKRSKPGSSIWFMTETSDRQVVSEYWLSVLGHDIEVEKHFAHINAWRHAPFKVYVVEQKVGDLILIPPLAPHQVWNRGTRTMKVAWNRTTVETLELALTEALPRTRLVCRDEQYKNKSIILFSLNKYYSLLSGIEKRRQAASDDIIRSSLSGPKIRQLRKDFKRLFKLFNEILLSESFSPDLPNEKKVEYLPYDSNVTCGYCRGNIFNRFLTCRHCVVQLEDGSTDTYDICMECYVMGRSCRCVGKLDWVEQFPWRDLLEKHELWRLLYIQMDGGIKESSPQPFQSERRYLRERSVAEICQMELKKRPYKDPKKPEPEEEPSDDSDSSDNSTSHTTKKNAKKKKKNEKWLADSLACHICCYRHPKWKEAICNCGLAYCYGALWRGFDEMPHEVLKRKDWKCPRCRKICTCMHCRKIPGINPFQPTGTVLGHDTRDFADPRSIESLVDFSVSNRHWIKKSGDDANPEESRRLQRRQSEAAKEREREHVDDDDDDEGEDLPAQATHLPGSPESRPGTSDEDIPIDPALTGGTTNWAEINEKFQAQSNASPALEAMNGLTRLEQDPAAFVLQAGLSNSGDQPLFVSPSAVMGDNDGNSVNRSSMNGLPSENSQTNGTTKKVRRKSGKNGTPKVQSDLPMNEVVTPSLPPTANQRFQQMAEKKRIEEAKRKNQLIAAKAAMKGLSKVVRLSLPSDRLASFLKDSSQTTPAQVGPQPNADTINEVVPHVESNLPKTTPVSEGRPKNARVSKKRYRQEDLDENFTSIPSRDRRTQKQIRESKSIAIDALEVQHVSDDDLQGLSEQSGGEKDTSMATVSNGAPAVHKRRSLPSYLAKRPAADPDALPKELQSEPRARSRAFKVSPSTARGVNGLKTSPTAQRREADRLAKIRAANGLSGSEDESGSDAAEADANLESQNTPRSPSKRRKVVLPRSPSAPSATPTRGGLARRAGLRGPGRGSIFASRGRGGKIRILSAKK